MCYTIEHTHLFPPSLAGTAVEVLLLCQKTEHFSMETTQTPWGIALTKERLADGVFWMETAEHGGILIETHLASTLLSAQALALGLSWNEFLVFEQEQDLPVIFYEHPELYPWIEESLTEKLAADCLLLAHPEYFRH
jgi:hypothetical protein